MKQNMTIIQFSDTHLRIDGKLSFGKEDTPKTVGKAIEYFKTLEDQPDFYVVTGDIVDNGIYEAYQQIGAQFKSLPRPVYILPGNHDDRENIHKTLAAHAPVKEDIKPYVCYTIDAGDVNVIVVDTSISHTHSGALSDPVAAWLEREVQKSINRPTLVFSHHPPFITGMSKMDEIFTNVDRYAAILAKHPNLKLCTGHIHCAINTVWHGIPVQTCPPVSMLMELDLKPGGGDRFFTADGGYIVHHFVDGRINSHIRTIPYSADYSGPWPFVYYSDDKH